MTIIVPDPGVPAAASRTLERLIIDPLSEDAANFPIDVAGRQGGHGLYLARDGHSYPPPDMASIFASSIDTEGSRKIADHRENRVIPLKLLVAEPSGLPAATNLWTKPTGEVAKKFDSNGPDFAVTRTLTGAIPALDGEYFDVHAFDGSGVDANLGYSAFTFSAAGTYALSIFVWIPSEWDGGAPFITSFGSYAGSTETVILPAQMASRDQWQRIATRMTVVGGDLVGLIGMYGATVPSSAPTGIVRSDLMVVELGADPTAPFTGDTPGCSWTGTPYASTSTRPESDQSRFTAINNQLEAKVEKLNREGERFGVGGTFKRYLGSGEPIAFDIIEAQVDGDVTQPAYSQGIQERTLSLLCRPFGRGAKQVFAETSAPTKPWITAVAAGVKGNVPGLGELTVKDYEGKAQQWAVLGLQSRFYDSAATADLGFEAEGRTILGNSATVAWGSGASGSGNNAVRTLNLGREHTAMFSTTAGGTYLTHVGIFRVFVRVYTPLGNTGDVFLRWAYAQGDLRRWTYNDEATADGGTFENGFHWVDVGQVKLDKAISGPQRWEGKLLTRAAGSGDSVTVDSFVLVPAQEGFGVARGVRQWDQLDTFTARDEFNQASGSLSGKTAPIGGNWTAAGSGGAYNVSGSGIVTRTIVSETAWDAKFAYIGSDRALHMAQVDVMTNNIGPSHKLGLLLRYIDTTNWLMLTVNPSTHQYEVNIRTGGGVTKLAYHYEGGDFPLADWVTLRALVDADGRYYLWACPQGAAVGKLMLTGYDSALITGGALDDGKVGIYDENTTGSAITRSYDNFIAGTPPAADAAFFANKSMIWRSDGAFREDSGSTAWNEVSDGPAEGLLVPPAGEEGRSSRVVVVTSRNDQPVFTDPAHTDDVRLQLSVTPRYLVVPEAA